MALLKCKKCNGIGHIWRYGGACYSCHGKGYIDTSKKNPTASNTKPDKKLKISPVTLESACPKCKGVGEIPKYGHIHGGVCFKCNGTGKLITNTRQSRWGNARDSIDFEPTTYSRGVQSKEVRAYMHGSDVFSDLKEGSFKSNFFGFLRRGRLGKFLRSDVLNFRYSQVAARRSQFTQEQLNKSKVLRAKYKKPDRDWETYLIFLF